jgi:hypothetical protein
VAFFIDAVADTGPALALGTDDHHVRGMKRGFKLDDAALSLLPSGLLSLLVLLHDVDALDYDAVSFKLNADNRVALSFIFTGDHLNGVTLFYTLHRLHSFVHQCVL